MEPDETMLFNHIRDWSINKIEQYNGMGVERIYDQMAIMGEFDEWLDPKQDLEIISLDQISEDEFDEYIDGVERS